jgi:hypothetical protein
MSNFFLKIKKSSNEESISEVHWNFLIYIFFHFLKDLNDMIVVKNFLESPFHI